MKGYKTSFVGMFQPRHDGMPTVNLVEIPLIQRDYAQGRQGADVEVIRRDFLDVLVGAVTGGDPVDLDFVYGEISRETHVLRPLDGQQRLTTLFLIHWYVAARLGRLEEASTWLRFSYATRQTAEHFCRQLVSPKHPLTDSFVRPSSWITDQPWYLFSWRHDPTVQSMLVMLDAIHERLSGEHVVLSFVWDRLVDTVSPPISFHFLPIDDMPSGEELYIKMNSRGKPLTEFENFKARFEKILANALAPDRFRELVHKIDGAWADVLWPYHDGDYIVDDEFLRYLEFIIEVCEWRQGVPSQGRLLDRAERAFAAGDETNVAFLFHAFDTWVEPTSRRPVDIGEVFGVHLASASDTGASVGDQVLLFDSANPNLFQDCCRRYGQKRGRARLFTLSETLFLFATLIHRQFDTTEIQARLRVLRNLTDRADDEVREERMPDLLQSTERLIRTGELEDLRGFNQDRVMDEIEKRKYLVAHPDQVAVLHRLEDHPLLRGRIFAFDLEPDRLASRVEAFERITPKELWPQLTAVLLANETNYGLPLGQRGYQFGSSEQESRWRDVFTRRGREKSAALRLALNRVLDAVAGGAASTSETLLSIITEFLTQCREAQRFDWRYYLAAYDEMREGRTGIYFGEHLRANGTWNYSMCMLRTDSLTGSAYYRDPFLLAVWNQSGVGDAVRDPWFRGYETEPRWLRLTKSEGGIRCINEGFELSAPLDERAAALWQQVCERHGAVESFLRVEQNSHTGEAIDSEDRVRKCSALLQDLVAAGL